MRTVVLLSLSRSFALAILLGIGAGSAVLAEGALRTASAQDVDIGVFYTSLAPHGEWFFQADLGWVWHPARVDAGWRPYTRGRWVWSHDYGWTWVSHEPWGWATYHYGRWYFDPIYGWSWVPGATWAPAWVSWRVEENFIGWAPLWPVWFDRHPQYRWDRWRHDRDWDHRHRDRDWDRWVFTRERDFIANDIATVTIRDRDQRQRILRTSRELSIDPARPESIGRSLDRSRIERATGRPLPTVRVEDADRPTRSEVEGETVRIYKPRVRNEAKKTPPDLGVAKAPTEEQRRRNTVREEKERLDRTTGGAQGPGRAERDPGRDEPQQRRDGDPQRERPRGQRPDGQPETAPEPGQQPQERSPGPRRPEEAGARREPQVERQQQREQQQQQREQQQQQRELQDRREQQERSLQREKQEKQEQQQREEQRRQPEQRGPQQEIERQQDGRGPGGAPARQGGPEGGPRENGKGPQQQQPKQQDEQQRGKGGRVGPDGRGAPESPGSPQGGPGDDPRGGPPR